VDESNWCEAPYLEQLTTLSEGRPVFQLVTNLTLSSDKQNFNVVLHRSIYVNNTLIRHKEFRESIPRVFQ